jgi:hypothetical protein
MWVIFSMADDILDYQGLCCMDLLSNKISGTISDRKFLVYLGDCQLLKDIYTTQLNNVHYTKIMSTAPIILCTQICII